MKRLLIISLLFVFTELTFAQSPLNTSRLKADTIMGFTNDTLHIKSVFKTTKPIVPYANHQGEVGTNLFWWQLGRYDTLYASVPKGGIKDTIDTKKRKDDSVNTTTGYTTLHQNSLKVTNVMTALGDLIYGGASGTPQNLSGNITTTQKFLSQTGTGSLSSAPSWQTIPLQGTVTYYLTDSTSDVATYKYQTGSPKVVKTTQDILNVNTTRVLENYITPVGVPNTEHIPAGQFILHIHCASQNPNTVEVYGELWETNSSGVDIALIGTTETTASQGGMQTSETEYELSFGRADVYNMASTSSRLVCRVWALRSSATHDMHIYVGGEADSHIELPGNNADVTNFVPYLGAISNLDLGIHSVFADSSYVRKLKIGANGFVIDSVKTVGSYRVVYVGGSAYYLMKDTTTVAGVADTSLAAHLYFTQTMGDGKFSKPDSNTAPGAITLYEAVRRFASIDSAGTKQNIINTLNGGNPDTIKFTRPFTVTDTINSKKLYVNQNAVVPFNGLNATIHTASADGQTNRILMDAFGAATNLIVRRAENTAASPQALTNNRNVFAFGMLGHDGTSYTTLSSANMIFQTSEAWTNVAHGARITWSTTLNGSISGATERMRLENDGHLGINQTTPGTWMLNVGGDVYVDDTLSAGTVVTPLMSAHSIGGGTTIASLFSASLAYDCGSIAAGVDSTFSITCTGAVAGCATWWGVSVAPEAGLQIETYCVSTNTIVVRLHNSNLVSAIDPANRTYRVDAINH